MRFYRNGCRLTLQEHARRGGVVEDIVIRRVRMKDIAGTAISFNLYYGVSEADAAHASPVPVSEETPEFRQITIEDTCCLGAKRAIELLGLPERPLRQIEFHRVAISAELVSAASWPRISGSRTQ
ncbi:MAG: hypothetical protein ACQEXQ_01460 [Bacillota bacterium]